MSKPTDKPYVHFAEVYDQIMADVPYKQWADYIQGVWARFSYSPRTVLDLACGTGNLSIILARRGYRVIGVDGSPNMLEVARKKAESAGLNIDFVEGDLRSFSVEHPVDAAVCVFDSLNYLLEPIHVQSAYRSVSKALVPGGFFVFDVNTPGRLAAIPHEISLMEGRNHYVVWTDYYDSSRKWWKVRLTGFIRQGKTWKRFDEIHRERAFPLDDQRKWLQDAGFAVLGVYHSTTFYPASEDTSRAYFVVKKE
jgi:SAM-dependent methyltransferase